MAKKEKVAKNKDLKKEDSKTPNVSDASATTSSASKKKAKPELLEKIIKNDKKKIIRLSILIAGIVIILGAFSAIICYIAFSHFDEKFVVWSGPTYEQNTIVDNSQSLTISYGDTGFSDSYHAYDKNKKDSNVITTSTLKADSDNYDNLTNDVTWKLEGQPTNVVWDDTNKRIGWNSDESHYIPEDTYNFVLSASCDNYVTVNIKIELIVETSQQPSTPHITGPTSIIAYFGEAGVSDDQYVYYDGNDNEVYATFTIDSITPDLPIADSIFISPDNPDQISWTDEFTTAASYELKIIATTDTDELPDLEFITIIQFVQVPKPTMHFDNNDSLFTGHYSESGSSSDFIAVYDDTDEEDDTNSHYSCTVNPAEPTITFANKRIKWSEFTQAGTYLVTIIVDDPVYQPLTKDVRIVIEKQKMTITGDAIINATPDSGGTTNAYVVKNFFNDTDLPTATISIDSVTVGGSAYNYGSNILINSGNEIEWTSSLPDNPNHNPYVITIKASCLNFLDSYIPVELLITSLPSFNISGDDYLSGSEHVAGESPTSYVPDISGANFRWIISPAMSNISFDGTTNKIVWNDQIETGNYSFVLIAELSGYAPASKGITLHIDKVPLISISGKYSLVPLYYDSASGEASENFGAYTAKDEEGTPLEIDTWTWTVTNNRDNTDASSTFSVIAPTNAPLTRRRINWTTDSLTAAKNSGYDSWTFTLTAEKLGYLTITKVVQIKLCYDWIGKWTENADGTYKRTRIVIDMARQPKEFFTAQPTTKNFKYWTDSNTAGVWKSISVPKTNIREMHLSIPSTYANEDNFLAYFCKGMVNIGTVPAGAGVPDLWNSNKPFEITFAGPNFVTVGQNFMLEFFSTNNQDNFYDKMIYNSEYRFVIPQIITHVGSGFLKSMFKGCNSLTQLPDIFKIPPNITGNVGDDFCRSMFEGCTALTSIGFNLPQTITSAGTNFCASMFLNCSALPSLPSSFNLPTNLTSVGADFCNSMFKGCAGLASLPTNFNIPQNITGNVSNNFLYGMFRGCTNVHYLPTNFKIPPNITSCGTNFLAYTFYNCKLRNNSSPVAFNLPNIPHGTGYCDSTFINTGLDGYNSAETAPGPGSAVPINRG